MTQVKFSKSKESIKTLILHIIGLVLHLSTNGVAYGHFLAKILKKDQSELKSYFQELGAHIVPTERLEKSSGKKVSDSLVSFKKIEKFAKV